MRSTPLTGLLALILALAGCAHAGTGQSTDVPPDQLKIEEVRAEKGGLVPEGTLLETKSYYLDAKGRQILHGSQVYFLENGKKRLEAQYRHDKLDGLLIEWSAISGDKVREETYVANRREGPAIEWYSNDRKRSECTYHLDRVVGKRLYWNPNNGRLQIEEVYDDAGHVAELTTWHDNATKSSHAQFKGVWPKVSGGPQLAGKRDGTWTYWDEDGKVLAEGQWKNGNPWEGTCIVPRESGSLIVGEKADYHEGNRVGAVTKQYDW